MTEITRADRELFDPLLGSDFMVDLMMSDREAWQQTGTLITRAFAAGKESHSGLMRRAVQEWLECECPLGMCPVYPHPVMREAAAACGWEPPEGVRPWQDEEAT